MDIATADLDKWVADAETNAARYRQLSDGMDQVTVTETAPDGNVTVTVNVNGVVTDLRISERATGMPGPRLATAVLTTMRRAQSRLAGRVAELMRDTVGQDTGLADTVVSDYQQKFPAPPEPQRPAPVDEIPIAQAPPRPAPPMPTPAVPMPPRAPRPAPRPRSAARPDDDWDEGNGSFMQEVDR